MNIVNKNYTEDTITYALHSINSTNAKPHNALFEMGHHLPQHYEFFNLNVIMFAVPQTKIAVGPINEIFTFELIDGVQSSSYNTNDQYESAVLATVSGHTSTSNVMSYKTEYGIKHVIRNWNGKILRFRYRNGIDNVYSVGNSSAWMNWSILLAITPVYTKLNEIGQYIHTKQYETFSYYISSVNKVSGDQYEYEIDIPPINDNYSEYFVNCNMLMADRFQNTLGAATYYTVVAVENLFDNGYGGFPKNHNKYILGYIFGTTNTSIQQENPSGDYAIFKLKNIKKSRRIKISYYNLYLDQITSINLSPTHKLMIHLLITPIK
jgi:hypothetical protein